MTRAQPAVALFLLGALAGLSAAAAQSEGLAAAPAVFVYFFGFSGEFLKLRLSDMSVASYWSLPRLPGAQDLLPPSSPPNERSAEGWLPRGLRYDSNRGRLYGVFPGKAEAAASIIAFQLPLLEVAGTLTLASPSAGPPVVLVTPDGSAVLVSYLEAAHATAAADDVVAVLERFDAASLQRTQRIEERVKRNDFELAKVSIGALLSPDAYFADDGRTIFDQGDTVVLGVDRAIRHHQNPLDALSAAQRDRLRPFETQDAVSGKPWLQYGYADSAAGHVLLVVHNSQRRRSAFFSIDIARHTASPVIDTVFSIGHLTPDARQVVVEEAEGRSDSAGAAEGGEAPRKTGRLRIYDVATGKEVRAIPHDELAGDSSQLLCIDRASTVMFFAARGGLYAVPLRSDAPVVRVQAAFMADQWTTCVFTNR